MKRIVSLKELPFIDYFLDSKIIDASFTIEHNGKVEAHHYPELNSVKEAPFSVKEFLDYLITNEIK